MSPRTIEQERVESASKVIAKHQARLALVCSCGEMWSPEHVAKALLDAGALGPRPLRDML